MPRARTWWALRRANDDVYRSVASVAAFEGSVARWRIMIDQLEHLRSCRSHDYDWIKALTPPGLSWGEQCEALGGRSEASEKYKQALYALLAANGEGSTPCAQLASLEDGAMRRFIADAKRGAR